jgi:hypothetical protein
MANDKNKSWHARWGNWAVSLKTTGDCWAVTVYRWPPGSGLGDRKVLATCPFFGAREEAVSWACGVMRSDGATVVVLDAPGLALEHLLRFTTAPELAA